MVFVRSDIFLDTVQLIRRNVKAVFAPVSKEKIIASAFLYSELFNAEKTADSMNFMNDIISRSEIGIAEDAFLFPGDCRRPLAEQLETGQYNKIQDRKYESLRKRL